MSDNGRLIVVTEPTRKRCAVCEGKIESGQLVFGFISSSFNGKSNYRWEHLRCVFLQSETLPTIAQYAEIFKEWTINKV